MRRASLVVAHAVLLAACAHTPLKIAPDADGCQVDLAFELTLMPKSQREALELVAEAEGAGEARQRGVEYLRVVRREGPGPETFCRLKAAVLGSEGLGADAAALWGYWTTGLVVMTACDDGSYLAAKRHLADLVDFAEASADPERARDLRRQQRLLDETRRHVVEHDLCPRPAQPSTDDDSDDERPDAQESSDEKES